MVGLACLGLEAREHTLRLVVLDEPYDGSEGAEIGIRDLIVFRQACSFAQRVSGAHDSKRVLARGDALVVTRATVRRCGCNCK